MDKKTMQTLMPCFESDKCNEQGCGSCYYNVVTKMVREFMQTENGSLKQLTKCNTCKEETEDADDLGCIGCFITTFCETLEDYMRAEFTKV